VLEEAGTTLFIEREKTGTFNVSEENRLRFPRNRVNIAKRQSGWREDFIGDRLKKGHAVEGNQ
jgi:hypothetical protein